MKTIKGDLLEAFTDGKLDVMVHGCNCFHVMGAGIAKQIASKYPAALIADMETVKGSIDKLGGFSESYEGVGLIINAYTQHRYGRGRQIDYRAIRQCFRAVKKQYGNSNNKFGIPKIGAGLGGGDWERIKTIIEEEMKDEDITLYIFN